MTGLELAQWIMTSVALGLSMGVAWVQCGRSKQWHEVMKTLRDFNDRKGNGK